MKFRYILFGTLVLLCVSCTKIEKTYYPDGNIQSSIPYRFGKENGTAYYYFDSPNTLEIEMEMKHGKKNGEFRRYFENGLLDTYCTYVNDSIEGVAINYTANGAKSQEFTYVHGIKNGPHKAYHLSGDIKIEGQFKNNLFDGKWTYYDERGVVVGEGSFKEGNGEVYFYDKRGLLLRLTRYINNKKDGAEEYYTPSGAVEKVIVFKQDRIVSEKTDTTLRR